MNLITKEQAALIAKGHEGFIEITELHIDLVEQNTPQKRSWFGSLWFEILFCVYPSSYVRDIRESELGALKRTVAQAKLIVRLCNSIQ